MTCLRYNSKDLALSCSSVLASEAISNKIGMASLFRHAPKVSVATNFCSSDPSLRTRSSSASAASLSRAANNGM